MSASAEGSRRTTPLRDVSEELQHCSIERRFELLSQAQFFSQLPDGAMGEANRAFREVHFAQHEWIYHFGDPAERMYIIAAGQVKLTRQGPDGTEVLLQLAAPGDLIGGLAAIGNNAYADGAQAHTDCCLLGIASSDFRNLLQKHPDVTMKVLEFAGNQLRQARDAIRSLSTGSTEQRIATTLLQLAARYGEESDGMLLIQTPLPQNDLAGMTGTTVETVSRTLSRFRRDGLVKTGRGWIGVTDEGGLRAIADTA